MNQLLQFYKNYHHLDGDFLLCQKLCENMLTEKNSGTIIRTVGTDGTVCTKWEVGQNGN